MARRRTTVRLRPQQRSACHSRRLTQLIAAGIAVVLEGGNDRGVLLDLHDTNHSQRFKLLGSLGYNAALLKAEQRAAGPAITTKLITAVSADGKRWTDFTNASSMQVAGDTANNVVWGERGNTSSTFHLWR